MKIDWKSFCSINYNWKEPPVRKACKLRGWFRHKPVPNHMSNHYVREHFWPDPEEPPTLF